MYSIFTPSGISIDEFEAFLGDGSLKSFSVKSRVSIEFLWKPISKQWWVQFGPMNGADGVPVCLIRTVMLMEMFTLQPLLQVTIVTT